MRRKFTLGAPPAASAPLPAVAAPPSSSTPPVAVSSPPPEAGSPRPTHRVLLTFAGPGGVAVPAGSEVAAAGWTNVADLVELRHLAPLDAPHRAEKESPCAR